jgi:NADPH-dependent ferric siderophore reductase
VITGSPGSWFLAGDETAIPAIRRFASTIPAGVPARIAIETIDPAHEVQVEAPVAVEWLHRGSAPAGSALIAHLEQLGADDLVGEDPFVFIAAEQSVVRAGRALIDRWSLDPARAVVKGYWKRGEAG